MLIVGFAIVYRLVQLPAHPIQEIDIYRYLWDGRVTLAGVNPYAYSPNEVLAEAGAAVTEAGGLHFAPRSPDGQRLATLLADPRVRETFQTVDHRGVPTIYPPMSQAVFALAAAATPADCGPRGQIIGMKTTLFLFDLGTIGVLILLLRAVGRSVHWCLAYAWCPLVIKEVANSGHLDVIAVFFTTLAIYLFVRRRPYAAAAAWAAAILAKVYPVVLLPLIVRHLWNLGGWRTVAGPLFLCGGLMAGTYLLVWPEPRVHTPTPFRGLQVFLTEWEMNDLLFRCAYRGVDLLLGPTMQDHWIQNYYAWWPHRTATADPTERIPIQPAFVLTYLLLAGLVAAFVLWLALRPWPAPRARVNGRVMSGGGAPDHPPADSYLIEGVFSTLAVLFLLSPTANPWYLLWALPFLPWARQASWFLLPGLVLQYYLRFWFIYHYPAGGPAVPGTNLDGYAFFDQVWLWVEYLPFFLLLLVECLAMLRRSVRA
jgi:hypothetical protein